MIRFVLLFSLCYGMDGKFDYFNIMCSRKAEMKQDNLPDKLLPKSYMITTRNTNWMLNSTAKYVEYFYDDKQRIITKTDGKGDQTWIVNHSNTLSINDWRCQNETGESALYNFSKIITDFFNFSSISLNDVISSVIHTKHFDQKGLKFTSVASGVDTIGWIGCSYNVTGDNTTGIQVLVSYAGDRSIPPYSTAFKNPLVYNIHFYVFKEPTTNETKNKIMEHYSIDVVTLDVPDNFTDVYTSKMTDGLYCENMTPIMVPFEFPSRFEAFFQYVDSNLKTVDTIEFMYDGESHITAYSLDFSKDRDFPLSGTPSTESDMTFSTVIRDFNYGIQYVLDRNSHVCHRITPLDVKMGDVDKQNNTYFLKNPNAMLLNANHSEFYVAGTFQRYGLSTDRYMSRKYLENGRQIVIQVDVLTSGWSINGVDGSSLYSITHYFKDKNGSITNRTILNMNQFVNTTLIGTSWNKYDIEPCIEAGENNLYYLILNDINMTIVRQIGYENVASSVVEAVAKSGNLSVLRVAHPFLKRFGDHVMAVFLIADKSRVAEPTKTAYFKEEPNVTQIVQNLNNTISSSEIKVKVVSDDLKSISFYITEFGILPDRYVPPMPSPQPPQGYSGSSMFILGLFMFIFGICASVGAYVFYYRRRTIAGIAYQVFE